MIVSGEYGEDQNARVRIEIFMKARHGWRIRSWQSQEKREGLELCLHHRNVRKVIFLLRVCSSKPRVIFRQHSYYRRNEQYRKKSTLASWSERELVMMMVKQDACAMLAAPTSRSQHESAKLWWNREKAFPIAVGISDFNFTLLLFVGARGQIN